MYLSIVDNGPEVFSAADRGSLQGVFGGDNSSRVVELEDEDLMEDIDQQAAAPVYQQPRGRHPPALGNVSFPSVDRNVDTYPSNNASYNAHSLSNPTYGMENSYIQQPSIYYSGHTHADMGATPNRTQQQPQPSNTTFADPGYAYNSTNAYFPAQDVDGGMASRSNDDTASGYPSQWSTQEEQYNWQRGAQDADFVEYSQGKLVWC